MTPGLVSVGFLHPDSWSACFGQSLLALWYVDHVGAQRIVSHPFGYIGKSCHAGRIVQGRNEIAVNVLEHSDAEWLLMVDSDMGFAPDTLERLIASADPVERPIVGGLCFAQKSDGMGPLHANRYRMSPTLYLMRETDDQVGFLPVFDYPRDAIVEVDATGSALVLIHRSVLEAIHAAHGPSWYDPITVPKGPSGRTEFSEDLSFCLRAAACGFRIHVDTSVRTTHDKGGIFLDEETYDLQRITREACGERAHA